MAIQIVMDRTGDGRHRFDPNDAQELAKAEQRFYELTGAGFIAAVRTGPARRSDRSIPTRKKPYSSLGSSAARRSKPCRTTSGPGLANARAGEP
jgi:hypothetical protein